MERFKNIFEGLHRAYGTFKEEDQDENGKKKGKAYIIKAPITDQLWEDHISGKASLGIIPIRDDSKCRWGCIDVDSYTLDHKQIVDKLNEYKIPLICCRSKSGGAHIFLFTTDFVPAKLMRDKLMSVSAILGFGNAEVFPKQIELKSQDDTGNFLNLPYFNGDNSTRYAFKEDGTAASLEEFYGIYNNVKQLDVGSIKVERPQSEFSDGPPCLESLTQTKLNDGRDRVIYQFIQYAKRKWPEEWPKKINQFNYTHFVEPLEDKVIQDKIKFHSKKDLGFKCNEEPMCNHCDKSLCKTRKFGIGGESVFPTLSDLQKVELDEPYYWVNVDGERIKLDTIDSLLEQRLFRRTVAKQINKKPPRITIKEFEKYTDMLLAGVEIIKAPIGSSLIEQLKDHLEEYCLNDSAATTNKEEIFLGNVWTHEGKHHFIFNKFFHGYLQRRKWPEKHQTTQDLLMQHCGCKDDRIYIGKKRPSVMIVDAFEKPEKVYQQKQLKPKDSF